MTLRCSVISCETVLDSGMRCDTVRCIARPFDVCFIYNIYAAVCIGTGNCDIVLYITNSWDTLRCSMTQCYAVCNGTERATKCTTLQHTTAYIYQGATHSTHSPNVKQ